RDALVRELQEQGVSSASVDCLLSLGELAGSATDVLGELHKLVGESAVGTQGVEAVGALLSNLAEVGIGDDRITLDPSIARGLDYYTGIVLESFLDELPGLGSVCSGGRYDNLAELYTKQFLPGVGASLGIDRLLAGLEELDKLKSAETPASIVLAYFDESHLGDYLRIAARLREHGLSVDFYPEPKKLGQQLKWAGKKGFQKALVIGSEEFKSGTAQLKDLATQQSTDIVWQGDLGLLTDAIKNELHE
ncbi:MAG: ATP phosphoribosyltransferase regulatory subunit, partial [Pirellulales bacterium]|nr:ATP phosphoribosyltransferase regulatory subunit [Pirellulales bacterium]